MSVAIGMPIGLTMSMPVCHTIADGMTISMPVGMTISMPIGMLILVQGICHGAAQVQLGGLVDEGRHIQSGVVGKEAHRPDHEARRLHRHDGEVLWSRDVGRPKHMPCDRICNLAVLRWSPGHVRTTNGWGALDYIDCKQGTIQHSHWHMLTKHAPDDASMLNAGSHVRLGLLTRLRGRTGTHSLLAWVT